MKKREQIALNYDIGTQVYLLKQRVLTYRIKVGEKENYGDGIFQTKKTS